jgi:hypothetical protein
MKMLTRFKVLLASAALAFGLAGVATAQHADVGFSPTTNLQGFPGLDVSLGSPPAVTGCNTSAPTVTGGASAGKIATAGTTTGCAVVLTWTIPKLGAGGVNGIAGGGYAQAAFAPALTGVVCYLIDLTTVADLFTQSATTYTAPTATANGSLTCTFTSRTIVASDVLLYTAAAF